MRRLFVGLCGVLVLCACSNSPPPPAPLPAPRRAASSYLPGDLDVVLCLDWARVRRELPVETAEKLLAGSADEASPTGRVLGLALGATDRLWMGVRPARSPELLDTVLVLEGNFSRVSPASRAEAFLPGRDLGNGWSVFEARSAPQRSSPARLYTSGEELWILASAAEIDAVERGVEHAQSSPGLVPPSRGLASVALRVQPLLGDFAARAPRATPLLENAQLLEASADLRSDGVALRVDLSFGAAEQAQRIERAVDMLLLLYEHSGRSSGVDQLRTEVVERTLVLEGRVSPERMWALLEQR